MNLGRNIAAKERARNCSSARIEGNVFDIQARATIVMTKEVSIVILTNPVAVGHHDTQKS